LSDAQIRRYKNPKEKEKLSNGLKKLWKDEEYRNKMHDARVRGATKQWQDLESRKKRVESISKAQTNLWKDEEYRKNQVKAFKKKWEDEGYRHKMLDTFTNVKPFTRSDGSVVNMRSTYEVRCSEYLDSLNIKWEFEKDVFEIHYEGDVIRHYIPDFYLPDYKVYIEVKSDFYYDKSNGDVDFRINEMLNRHHQIVFLVRDAELESIDSFRAFLVNHGCADTLINLPQNGRS
jgi:hypothetical protein